MVQSLFVWIGTVCAFNQSEGGVPEFIDFWNIIVRMGVILEAISFRILAGMLSGHWALFGFNSLTDCNWFEKISALDLLPVWRMPLSFSGEIPVESLLSDFK